jgi:transposase InsO family protein
MVSFIDAHRDVYGVEPICAQLPIAPSQYYEHKGRQVDPERRPPRLRRDEALPPQIRRVGLFKTEVIHHRGPWRNLEAVESATLEWVDWFNHRRLLESIGNIPPAEREATYHQSTSQLPMAA